MALFSKTESGRTLIEVLGVIAIGGLLTVSAVMLFQNVRRNQNQMIMVDDLRTMNENIQILFAGRADFTGLNTDYLIKAGVLKAEETSISKKLLSMPDVDSSRYILEFSEVPYASCTYFSLVNLDFVSEIRINNYDSGKPENCLKGAGNKVSFYFDVK